MSEIKLVYFAWVRERTGCAEETLTLPSTIRTIADLAAWLATRDEAYAQAFEQAGIFLLSLELEARSMARAISTYKDRKSVV